MKTLSLFLGLALIGLTPGGGGNTRTAYTGSSGILAAQARPTSAAAPMTQLSGKPERPLPPLAYEPKGRRDPFRPLPVAAPEEEPNLQLYAVKLVGIVQGRQGPMALVESPDGLGFIVKKGDAIAEGRVTEVGTDTVTVGVVKKRGASPTPYVMRLSKE